MRIFLALAIAGLLSFSVHAGSNTATEMGPFVDCKFKDGSMDYIPSEICKMKGGMKLY